MSNTFTCVDATGAKLTLEGPEAFDTVQAMIDNGELPKQVLKRPTFADEIETETILGDDPYHLADDPDAVGGVSKATSALGESPVPEGFGQPPAEGQDFPGGDPSKSWTNDEIVAYAAAHSIDLGEAGTKAEYLAAIEAAAAK